MCSYIWILESLLSYCKRQFRWGLHASRKCDQRLLLVVLIIHFIISFVSLPLEEFRFDVVSLATIPTLHTVPAGTSANFVFVRFLLSNERIAIARLRRQS